MMARFKSTDTAPERSLRSVLRSAGLAGYRVNARGLPGKPDVAYTRWKVAIFVDGEFWHGHPDVFRFGTKGPYWDAKVARNKTRDRAAEFALNRNGWRVLRVWSLDVRRNPRECLGRVVDALAAAGHPAAIRAVSAAEQRDPVRVPTFDPASASRARVLL